MKLGVVVGGVSGFLMSLTLGLVQLFDLLLPGHWTAISTTLNLGSGIGEGCLRAFYYSCAALPFVIDVHHSA